MANSVRGSKGKATGNRVLKAGFDLFVNQGYHGTSMRQIALAAGLTPASIYNHFPGKEEIFRQVLMEHHPYHQILPILESAVGEDAEAMLRNVARRVYKVVSKQKGLLHIMFIEMVEFEGKHFGQIFRSMSPRIFKFIDRIRAAKGQLRNIPESNILLTMIGLVMSHWIIERMFLKNIKLPFGARHFESALEIYMHGILKKTN